MRLKVIGSSSKGNGYILDNGKEALVIEAGVPYAEVLREVNYMNNRIVGCLVSHEHGDHAGYISQYIRAQIDVFGSSSLHEQYNSVLPYQQGQFMLGGFTIKPFRVFHDVECWGFIIRHSEMGQILFLTDSNGLGRYRLPKLDFILLETNYDRKFVDENVTSGTITKQYRDRVYNTHMGLNQALDILSRTDLSRTQFIALLHLSHNNSNESAFVNAVQGLTGIKTFVAKPKLNVSIDKIPF